MSYITDEKIKSTVMTICNSFASTVFSMDMTVDEQMRIIEREFKNANAQLYGILLLIDTVDDIVLFEFVECYIQRLKNVYQTLTARGQKIRRMP